MSMVSVNSAITFAAGWIERFLPSHGERTHTPLRRNRSGVENAPAATTTAWARTESRRPDARRPLTPRARPRVTSTRSTRAPVTSWAPRFSASGT